MKTAIPSLIVGDVIETQGFKAKVVETKKDTYLGRSVVYLEFISGDKFNFNFLHSSKKPEFACIAGNELGYVWLDKAEFLSE